MALHDAYARRTPYELAFVERARAEDLVRRVDEEAAGRGADPHDPTALVTMGAVADFIRAIEGPDRPPEALHSFGALAYHGVHFTREGCPLYLLATAAARYLVEGSPAGTAAPVTRAGYLQLPQHLFWAEGEGEAAPESVDGVFWTATPAGVLHAMIATGLRPDRPGLAVVPLPPAPLAEADDWLRVEVRPEGGDFESRLPGAELDSLYAFRSAGEILKLLARFFAYVGHVPGALEARRAERDADGPAPSTLDYSLVTLSG